jgi:hypothetical protein
LTFDPLAFLKIFRCGLFEIGGRNVLIIGILFGLLDQLGREDLPWIFPQILFSERVEMIVSFFPQAAIFK